MTPEEANRLRAEVIAQRDEIADLKHLLAEFTGDAYPHIPGLTPGQSRVVNALLAAKGRVLTRDQILTAYAHHGFGFGTDVGPKLIDAQLSKARKRLAEMGSPIRIDTVWGIGWRIEPAREMA